MNKLRLIIVAVLLPLLASAQTGKKDFVKGADVGFLTGQERHGVQFHDRHGAVRECLELLKNDYQMSAIRMRVWVNPRGGSCDKNELLAMARRVKALGMDLMVDFHYSDSWADPAKQPIPKAWQGHSYKEMRKDLRQHTIEVLTLLKDNGIEPRWVQVGNETTSGMLLPTGRIQWEDQPGHRFDRYVTLSNAGYEAVKAVCPKTEVVIHIDNSFQAWEGDCCWFREYIEAGGKVDVIGLSHYATPEFWNRDSVHVPSNINAAKSVEALHRRFGKPVMLVETGFPTDDPELWRTAMSDLYTRLQAGKSCAGVFYWEPQVFRWWRPGYYIRNNWGAYNMGAFTWDGQPMKGFLPE